MKATPLTNLLAASALLALSLQLLHSVSAFSPSSVSIQHRRVPSVPLVPSGPIAPISTVARTPFQLHASSEDDANDADETIEPSDASTEVSSATTATTTPASPATSTATPVDATEDKKYPLNIPSPILLATSMVLAIASTGSLFELTGPNTPKLGFGPTAGIALVGLPACLYLFYAAILKGMAETEEDDLEYNKPRRL